MKDGFERNIDYLRISVTDRCDLRCVYCMPESGVEWLPHASILTYEQILRLCRVFVSLGVTKFKITGGEPLVRKNVASLIKGIKAIPGADSVTMTTNGVSLYKHLPQLIEAGIDGINISLDTLDRGRYAELTRRDALESVLKGIDAAVGAKGPRVKLNCVSMKGREDDWISLASLARDRDIAVRFIEPMPIGLGGLMEPCCREEVASALEAEYGKLIPFEGKLGNGPSQYWSLDGFKGKIGFISAVSHKFCSECNRVRLTATGYLKTCLQYDIGTDLSPRLTGADDELAEIIRKTIMLKPAEHAFDSGDVKNREKRKMNKIGG